MAELEKAGVPTVAFVAQSFEKNFQASAKVFGVGHLSMAVVPRPLVGMDAEDIYPLVDAHTEALAKSLTQPVAPGSITEETVRLGEIIAIEGEDRYAALEEMNRLFLMQGWGDGFPMWAPTRQRVDEMLQGTRRSADEVIATLAPGGGLVTVEKIAINGVMAGCKPEYLPALIAMVKAISDSRFMLRSVAQSTGAHAPLLLFNGPVVKRLGINVGRCALGPGALSAVNTVLGRTLRLFYMNLGHAYPGTMDMDTLGSPTKYSMCLGENEDASPWEPFHVEKGFDKDASVVTVHSTYSLMEVEDNVGTTPQQVLDSVISNACSRGIKSVGYWLQGWRADPTVGVQVKDRHMLIVGPVHAAVFRKHGWSRQDVRDYLYKHARMPFDQLISNLNADAFRQSRPDMQWIWDSPGTLVPILETPDCFELVVAGGAGSRSTYSGGSAGPVSCAIEE